MIEEILRAIAEEFRRQAPSLDAAKDLRGIVCDVKLTPQRRPKVVVLRPETAREIGE